MIKGQAKHLKRGSIYDIFTSEATLQLEEGRTLNDGDQLYVYVDADGRVWLRHQDEFNDGRFEQVADTQTKPVLGSGALIGKTPSKELTELLAWARRWNEETPEEVKREHFAKQRENYAKLPDDEDGTVQILRQPGGRGIGMYGVGTEFLMVEATMAPDRSHAKPISCPTGTVISSAMRQGKFTVGSLGTEIHPSDSPAQVVQKRLTAIEDAIVDIRRTLSEGNVGVVNNLLAGEHSKHTDESIDSANTAIVKE